MTENKWRACRFEFLKEITSGKIAKSIDFFVQFFFMGKELANIICNDCIC